MCASYIQDWPKWNLFLHLIELFSVLPEWVRICHGVGRCDLQNVWHPVRPGVERLQVKPFIRLEWINRVNSESVSHSVIRWPATCRAVLDSSKQVLDPKTGCLYMFGVLVLLSHDNHRHNLDSEAPLFQPRQHHLWDHERGIQQVGQAAPRRLRRLQLQCLGRAQGWACRYLRLISWWRFNVVRQYLTNYQKEWWHFWMDQSWCCL